MASFYLLREFMDPLLHNIKGEFCLKKSDNVTRFEANFLISVLGSNIYNKLFTLRKLQITRVSKQLTVKKPCNCYLCKISPSSQMINHKISNKKVLILDPFSSVSILINEFIFYLPLFYPIKYIFYSIHILKQSQTKL